MLDRHLRLYDENNHISHSDASPAPVVEPKRVAVALGDVLPLLLQAAVKNHLWLDDMAAETLEVSQDLYEVLLVYRRLNAQRAA